MQDNTNNKQFWDNYVTYWEERVKQANAHEKISDRTSDDDILGTYFRKLEVNPSDKVLDYGCGSGRLYPIYKRSNPEADNYYGIDISGVSLTHASSYYKELEIGRNLYEFDGLHIPFNDNYFDKIICFGVFDACNQETVLRELLRVLRRGGMLLITGKNSNYYSDDESAITAEINARKKGHPNYFTDVNDMISQLEVDGINVIDSNYFLRRGDFPLNKYEKTIPDIFYEWALLLSKGEKYKGISYNKFSKKYSMRTTLSMI